LSRASPRRRSGGDVRADLDGEHQVERDQIGSVAVGCRFGGGGWAVLANARDPAAFALAVSDCERTMRNYTAPGSDSCAALGATSRVLKKSA